MTQDETMIYEVLESRITAFQRKDLEAVTAVYSNDVVSFELPPPLRLTAEQVLDRDEMQKWFDTWRGPIGWYIRDVRITASDDVAFAHSLNRMTGTKVTGERVDLWVRQTNCFRKIDGTWKITHQHTSVPFHMDGSGRAALDLRP